MKGFTDGLGRALLSICVHSVNDEQTEDVDVCIDTGFTGEFVLPRDITESLFYQHQDPWTPFSRMDRQLS